MIDISKGRYWDLPWSLISGCTPCSPGCDHCWSAAMEHRFKSNATIYDTNDRTDFDGKFNGRILTHPERLCIPLKRRKPTVYAIWNDLFHEAVQTKFLDDIFNEIGFHLIHHIFLILTKRPGRMKEYFKRLQTVAYHPLNPYPNVWSGLTVCNQQEADEKIPVFLQVPGKKFLSIEPMLSEIWLPASCLSKLGTGGRASNGTYSPGTTTGGIDAVILGGETGPKARPLHSDWVRSVRDQCSAAGVPFFFKGWGEWAQSEYKAYSVFDKSFAGNFQVTTCVSSTEKKHVGQTNYYPIPLDYDGLPIGIARMERKKNSSRLLDGRAHDELPWIAKG